MTRFDKLINKVLKLSNDLRFSEIKKVLESFGYKMCSPGGGSSHYIFRKKGCNPVVIPKHEPIKRCYVEIVRNAIEREANDE